MGHLDKLIVAKGFKKLPKVQKIAQFGHTEQESEKYNVQKHWEKKEVSFDQKVLKLNLNFFKKKFVIGIWKIVF